MNPMLKVLFCIGYYVLMAMLTAGVVNEQYHQSMPIAIRFAVLWPIKATQYIVCNVLNFIVHVLGLEDIEP